MKAFDAAWDLLKSIQNFQSFAPEKFVRLARGESVPHSRFEPVLGYNEALDAGDAISTLAERNAIGEILDEMGIPLAAGGFARANPSNAFYSPLHRGPTGLGNYRSRVERGIDGLPTVPEQIEQASYYTAIDPQNDYTMQDHYARYPAGGQ